MATPWQMSIIKFLKSIKVQSQYKQKYLQYILFYAKLFKKILYKITNFHINDNKLL